MLTNKQIAITRLVDARLYGYTRLILTRSSIPDIYYLQTEVSLASLSGLAPYRMNICALKNDREMESTGWRYGKPIGMIASVPNLPLEAGLELVENHYWFLTYNRKDLP